MNFYFLNFASFFNLSVWQVLWWLYSIVFVILFLLSCFGRQLGLRRKYTNLLLKLFEYGHVKIQKKRQKRSLSSQITEEDTDTSDLIANPNLSFEHPCSLGTNFHGYHLDDILPYITAGVASIVEDDVTPQFVSEQLPYWNLLSRTNTNSYEFISIQLTLCWVIGFIIRYFLLLPLRVIILIAGMMIFFLCSLLVGPIADGSFKRRLNAKISTSCFDFVAGSLSLVATFHNTEHKPRSGIAVANHTSPIDSMVLATDSCYDMVGQKHGGLLGFFMRVLSRSSSHIWFERFEAKDRELVSKRLRQHANNPDLPPILIFPEGVCVNNTSVMQFRKGAFEVADVIYPVAIKFDPRFGDAFWWQDHFSSYILCMMTSWAIVCDVWYLPAMQRNIGEPSIDFAKRVKASIAAKGGLTDISWDGFLKVAPVKEEWLAQQQLAFAKYVLDGPIKEMDNTYDDIIPDNISFPIHHKIENIATKCNIVKYSDVHNFDLPKSISSNCEKPECEDCNEKTIIDSMVETNSKSFKSENSLCSKEDDILIGEAVTRKRENIIISS